MRAGQVYSELQIANKAANQVENISCEVTGVGRGKDWDSFLMLRQTINFCSFSNLIVGPVHGF